MRSIYHFVLVGLMCLPSIALGQIAAVLDLTNTRPGTYYYSVTLSQDGSLLIKPVSKVVAIGSDVAPIPNPTPQPPPYVPPIPQPNPIPPLPPQPTPVQPESIEVKVQNLTQNALNSGGSVTTAVSLQRVYNIVGSTLDTNKLPKEKTFEALRIATDLVMEQSKEQPKWASWRSGVSIILADLQANRQIDTKDATVNVVRRIENGMKNTLNTLGVGAQDNIKWEDVLRNQQGIADAISKLK